MIEVNGREHITKRWPVLIATIKDLGITRWDFDARNRIIEESRRVTRGASLVTWVTLKHFKLVKNMGFANIKTIST